MSGKFEWKPEDIEIKLPAKKAETAEDSAELAELRPFGHELYVKSLRAPVRGLWSGQIDAREFAAMMRDSIARGLTDAWYAGAAKVGIDAKDLTPAELQAALAELRRFTAMLERR